MGIPEAATDLKPDETLIAQRLGSRLFERQGELDLSRHYYDGMQPVTNLGISTPPELRKLRAIFGWCQSGVNAIDERLTVNGFRLPNSPAVDESLWDIWQANNLDADAPLVHLDSLIYGSAYVIVGPGDDGYPLITAESPRNMIAVTDTRKRKTKAAYQTYLDTDPTSETYGRQLATLYTLNATVHMVDQGAKGWTVIDRDDHGFGEVPVVPFLNRQSTGTRHGRSEITDAWRNTVDRACRTAVAMEIAREYYAIPQRYILGAVESAFQKADGTGANVWEVLQGMILALEADKNGNLPQVGTFATGDPSNFTKLLDLDVHMMAGLTGLPPHYLGIYSEGNPSSADAIRLSDFRLEKAADRKSVIFGDCWERVMRLAVRVDTNGAEVSDDMRKMETDWAPRGIPTPAATTDSVTKQVAAEILPADSDVTLTKLGYTATERARIAADRQRAQGRADLLALVNDARARQAAQNQQQPSEAQPGQNPPPAELPAAA
ncbi:phage portal protein [Micromonospora sp. NPDC005367]|uniref:phage portal protein n=1 Tax=Micromonospora sp. NPDC005367 TaxID=3155590 RepID=UPI0033B58CEF